MTLVIAQLHLLSLSQFAYRLLTCRADDTLPALAGDVYNFVKSSLAPKVHPHRIAAFALTRDVNHEIASKFADGPLLQPKSLADFSC